MHCITFKILYSESSVLSENLKPLLSGLRFVILVLCHTVAVFVFKNLFALVRCRGLYICAFSFLQCYFASYRFFCSCLRHSFRHLFVVIYLISYSVQFFGNSFVLLRFTLYRSPLFSLSVRLRPS